MKDMDSHLSPADPVLEEQLVAYLDGELDAESCRRIEDLLAANPQARLALQRLEKTWELLENLETKPTGENFTRTTLEMVAVAAEDEVQKQETLLPRRTRRRGLLAAGGILAAATLGYAALAALAPDPNRRLVEDLPVLEHLDEYRQVNDIEFLKLLQKNGLFEKEEHDG
jgi:anti-sigma factor RsiW